MLTQSLHCHYAPSTPVTVWSGKEENSIIASVGPQALVAAPVGPLPSTSPLPLAALLASMQTPQQQVQQKQKPQHILLREQQQAEQRQTKLLLGADTLSREVQDSYIYGTASGSEEFEEEEAPGAPRSTAAKQKRQAQVRERHLLWFNTRLLAESNALGTRV